MSEETSPEIGVVKSQTDLGIEEIKTREQEILELCKQVEHSDPVRWGAIACMLWTVLMVVISLIFPEFQMVGWGLVFCGVVVTVLAVGRSFSQEQCLLREMKKLTDAQERDISELYAGMDCVLILSKDGCEYHLQWGKVLVSTPIFFHVGEKKIKDLMIEMKQEDERVDRYSGGGALAMFVGVLLAFGFNGVAQTIGLAMLGGGVVLILGGLFTSKSLLLETEIEITRAEQIAMIMSAHVTELTKVLLEDKKEVPGMTWVEELSLFDYIQEGAQLELDLRYVVRTCDA